MLKELFSTHFGILDWRALKMERQAATGRLRERKIYRRHVLGGLLLLRCVVVVGKHVAGAPSTGAGEKKKVCLRETRQSNHSSTVAFLFLCVYF